MNSDGGDVNQTFKSRFSVVSSQFVENAVIEPPGIFKNCFSRIVAVGSHHEKEIAWNP
jgi:hypothetical protein